jgi:hypothetical protein
LATLAPRSSAILESRTAREGTVDESCNCSREERRKGVLHRRGGRAPPWTVGCAQPTCGARYHKIVPRPWRLCIVFGDAIFRVWNLNKKLNLILQGQYKSREGNRSRIDTTIEFRNCPIKENWK